MSTNTYSVRKSNGRSSYVTAKNEAEAKKVALQGEAKDVTATRVVFVKAN